MQVCVDRAVSSCDQLFIENYKRQSEEVPQNLAKLPSRRMICNDDHVRFRIELCTGSANFILKPGSVQQGTDINVECVVTTCRLVRIVVVHTKHPWDFSPTLQKVSLLIKELWGKRNSLLRL
ncbi:hypothetical protein WK41_21985 [Burkholderia cepacia]|nr:hypothetical protein WK41_21985 [Burkholderia cepacia]